MPTKQVTIADGASTSDGVQVFDQYDNNPETLVGIIVGASFTTADLTFQGSVDGTTYVTAYNAAGAALTVAGAQSSRWIALDPADFAGFPYIKVLTSVAQASGDTLTLVTRRL